MSGYVVRRATDSDAAVIAWHRTGMFLDMGDLPEASVEAFQRATTPWIAERLATGEYLGWLVEYEGTVVAGGGILLRDLWPTPKSHHAGRHAHVGSVYTERTHRRQGLARLVMCAILDWCTENEVTLVTLSASREGRPLYEQLGFEPDIKAMRLSGAPSRRHSAGA